MLVFGSKLNIIMALISSVLAKDFFTSLGEMTTLVSTCEHASIALESFMVDQIERFEKAKK